MEIYLRIYLRTVCLFSYVKVGFCMCLCTGHWRMCPHAPWGPRPIWASLRRLFGGAGDDSVGCWAPGQGALASVALDFHARHWVPPACYLSALKYPAFGHSVLKITSVGAVLFSQLIRELYACNEVFQLPPGGRAAAGFVFHGVPAVRSCVIQSLIDTAQNGEKCILAGSPLSIEFWILLGLCCALSLQSRFQAPAKDVSVPWQPELLWDFWNGAGVSQQGLPIEHPMPLLLSWLNFCHPLGCSDQSLGLTHQDA